MNTVLLSVIVPCYNEEATLRECIKRLLALADNHTALQIVIVDDCSTDQSHKIAAELAALHSEITCVKLEMNRGKGHALKTGFQNAKGAIIAIQDADLEYDPQDIKRLITPIVAGTADVVYGSRYLSADCRQVHRFWHTMANRLLTLASNCFTNLHLTDMETCYKVFRSEVLDRIDIQEKRFGVEPEITAKMAKLRVNVCEMPISYNGRTYDQGKKIGLRDGLRAIYCILKYNLFQKQIDPATKAYPLASAMECPKAD